MVEGRPPLPNRGTSRNPANRFVPLEIEPDPEELESEVREKRRPGTQFLADTSRSIITYNKSEDVGFEASLNPYRGCEHGCVYCYARPTHEYLGFSAGLDFETKILVKEDAPALLEKELAAPGWKPQMLALSGVTDPYQPIEGRLRLTRRCLEVLAGYRNPVAIVTKNHLVRRDADILERLAQHDAAGVFLSVTTLRPELYKVLEPRTCHPERRLEAISELSRRGIPTGVLVAPVIPGLTDHELPAIIEAAANAGASYAGYVVLRLPHAVKSLFETWLEDHFPDRKGRVLNRIRSLRSGDLNDPRPGVRMRGEGIFAEQIQALFRMATRKAGVDGRSLSLSTKSFRNPRGRQLKFFEED
jgi:DNA repair photolyase